MEIRLNKIISESGLCSRREADKWIETGRVTVNGKQPHIGQKVTEADEVRVDGERLSIAKYIQQALDEPSSDKMLSVKPARSISSSVVHPSSSRKQSVYNKPETGNDASEPKISVRSLKYGKYNKYAALRKAEKAARETHPSASSKKGASFTEENALTKRKSSGKGSLSEKERLLKEAAKPQFGKSLKRSAVAQRMAASPKSASLRKTSRNNPLNKAKRSNRNKSNS